MTIKSEDQQLEDKIPHKIGGYKIESLLDKGGMSLLYLGIHPETGEPITIKVLSSKYVSHPEMVERFMREAEIIQLTNHPNIVKLFGHGKWEGGVYIAMEFIQGLSLRQMILQQAMSLKRALEVILQIGHALTHLHVHGIIHRDLKPENILLTAQGGVKVIDFGISQLYTEKENPEKKRIMGTPAYMSPEQRKNPLDVTFSTDIFALGVIAYELILGRLSFGTIHLSMLPRGMQKVLVKALDPDPAKRYEDIVDFIKAISDYMASDTLKKDMRGSDYLGELSENLKEAQSLFIPKRLPKWPRIDMGIASNASSAISSVYYDFFQLQDNSYNIVMGESLESGVEGLLQIAMLRGMIHALSHEAGRPAQFVATLNDRVASEGRNLSFSFSFLSISPTEGRFSYISCGYSPLWYLASGTETPRQITSDNPPLGECRGEIIEVDSNWSVGDTLVLHTFQAGLAKQINEIESDEELFLEALKENIFLPPQRQVEAIYRKISNVEGKEFFGRLLTVISIARIG